VLWKSILNGNKKDMLDGRRYLFPRAQTIMRAILVKEKIHDKEKEE